MKTQIHYRTIEPTASKIKLIQNRIGVKPKGGFWTSTYTPNNEFTSDWHRAHLDMFGEPDQAWLLEIKETAEIYTIDSYSHLLEFAKKYEIKNDYGLQSYDWVRFLDNYDALRLTRNGQWRTRLTSPYNLYGWDSESTLWSNWCFESIKKLENLILVEEI